ncbi:MAG: hypothetical protein ACR2N3_08425 [Pyrinomonadaceae bacterium]
MSSPFLYRLRVMSSKKGQGRAENIIPIYAFKDGTARGSPFPLGEVDLNTMRIIALGADGARVLTVCAFSLNTYRALENKDVEFFELHIKDTRIKTASTEEGRTVATITRRDMIDGQKIPIDPSRIKMSCEPLPMSGLFTVSSSFFDYDGGPVFALA